MTTTEHLRELLNDHNNHPLSCRHETLVDALINAAPALLDVVEAAHAVLNKGGRNEDAEMDALADALAKLDAEVTK